MLFKDKQLDLSTPRVMGILNVTPDSFSDGGLFTNVDSALRQASSMLEEGASILDIGGESTRPGAQPVSDQQELDRVIPVIEAINKELDVIISIDTSKAVVMREAIKAGAHFVNDVYALRGDNAEQTVAELNVPVCLMHMQGEPRTMQAEPVYQDVVAEVLQFLQQRSNACMAAGISQQQIILDPGFGFGKTLQHNLALFRALPEFIKTGMPVLVGVSRKSMIGSILDLPVDKRLHGSTALASLAVWLGASIIRVHDVGPTYQAIQTVMAVRNFSGRV
jgi:dihydropteroate synthase